MSSATLLALRSSATAQAINKSTAKLVHSTLFLLRVCRLRSNTDKIS